jgi:hypothetical protein
MANMFLLRKENIKMALWKPLRGNRTALDSVEKHDGYVYFCIDDGTLFFDYQDENGNLQRKQINAKEAETLGLHTADEFLLKSEAMQSDWNQNDETKSDYIKNRTHYEGIEKVLTDTFTWDGNTEGLVTSSDGQYYLVLPDIMDVPKYGYYVNGSEWYPDSMGGNGFSYYPDLMIIYEDNCTIVEYPFSDSEPGFFPKKGSYFITDGDFYISNLVYDKNIFETEEKVIKQIDSKFIGNDIARTEDVISHQDLLDGSLIIGDPNNEEWAGSTIEFNTFNTWESKATLTPNSLTLYDGANLNEYVQVGDFKIGRGSVEGSEYAKESWQQFLDINDLNERVNALTSGGLTRSIVSELPDRLEANEQTIYMVGPKDDNTYDEYMYVASKDDYELIGNTNVDLSNYLYTDEDGYVTKDIKVGDSTSSSTLGRASLDLWNSG